jgi:molybdopterin converting factor small subunit
MRSSALKEETGTSPIFDPLCLRFPGCGIGFAVIAYQIEAMKVKITLHGTLRIKRQDLVGRDPVASEATTIGELLRELNLSRAEAPIIFVNEKRAGFESLIQDGDEIKVFPILGGG